MEPAGFRSKHGIFSRKNGFFSRKYENSKSINTEKRNGTCGLPYYNEFTSRYNEF